MTKNKPEFDGPWKDILDIYFEQFIAYCWPIKYAEFKFIDWVIALPPELELEYNGAIEEIEEECKMAYVSTAERVGIRKGEGEMLVLQLNTKFQTVPQKYLDKIKNAPAERLMAWAKKLMFAPKIEDVFEDENTVVIS